MLVLKLGGSLLTDKSQPYSLRSEVLRSVSAEIRSCIEQGLIQKLVIVHGVGSYGHPPVIQYKLHKGFIDRSQLLPLSRTQTKVNELRAAITISLQDVGIPVNLFHTSSIAMAKRGKIVSMELKAVKGYLEIGMVPVLGGDVVSDEDMGFSIGSGDQVAAIMARELGATDLVLATDVAGVFDKDPKTFPGARFQPWISLTQLDEISSSVGGRSDASGAMRGKLLALTSLREELQGGLNMHIISMSEPGKLTKLLKGEQVEATQIRA